MGDGNGMLFFMLLGLMTAFVALCAVGWFIGLVLAQAFISALFVARCLWARSFREPVRPVSVWKAFVGSFLGQIECAWDGEYEHQIYPTLSGKRRPSRRSA